MRARALLALLAAALLSGCDRRASAPADAAPSSAPAAAPEPTLSARRPTRRYLLVRNEARCEVYRVDPDGVSPATPTPCPNDLLPGERIRIVGMVCMREGGDPGRVLPVVCPDPLTNMEKRDRGLLK